MTNLSKEGIEFSKIIPIPDDKMKFGICTAGLEKGIEKYLRLVCKRFSPINYLEIGVAFGGTLLQTARVLSKHSKDWTASGADLPNWFFSEEYDKRYICGGAREIGLQIDVYEWFTGKVVPKSKTISLFLKPSGILLWNNWRVPIHYGFIDGCHCKKCVMNDFILMEPFVPVGGIIAFHDFGEDLSGQPQGDHGTTDVIGACEELGLLSNKRGGWVFTDDIEGDKTKNGKNLGIFERT